MSKEIWVSNKKKNSLPKKSQGQMASLVNSTEYLKKI